MTNFTRKDLERYQFIWKYIKITSTSPWDHLFKLIYSHNKMLPDILDNDNKLDKLLKVC